MHPSPTVPITLLALLHAPAPFALGEFAQDGTAAESGAVLIPWQRTLEDAEAISRTSGRPLLICVNTDGEEASEYFVERRYDDPEFAALVQSFVPLVLSPDRHAPRDWDETGRRIPCPRFGTVVCSEHIDAEPLAYERYFGGERVAPRHVIVAPDGKVLVDLKWLHMSELLSVDEALAAHGQQAAAAWERFLDERSSTARTMLECAYLASPVPTRRSMLEQAASGENVQTGLFRLGLNEPDHALREAAALALARTADGGSESTLQAALRLELRDETQAELLDALRRVARSEPSLRLIADLEASRTPSTRIDVEAWRASWSSSGTGEGDELVGPAQGDSLSDEELYELIDELARRVREQPQVADLELRMAHAWLELGQRTLAAGKNPTFLFMDARSSCERAAAKGATGGAVAALRARTEWLLGEPEAAARAAEEALPALLAEIPPADAADVLAIFALGRTSEIYAARGRNEAFAPDLLSDAHAAYSVLAEHPSGTAEHARAHADLLLYLDLQSAAGAALHRALSRFPSSPEVHERFRRHVAASRGIPSLERAYADLSHSVPDLATLGWFTGYALLVVAEDGQRASAFERADQAYAHATRSFEAAVAARPDYADSANHYVALALAARARLALDRDDTEVAIALVTRAIAVRPESAESPDGLGRTPLDTLRRVRQTLEASGREHLVLPLASAVSASSPELWEKANL